MFIPTDPAYCNADAGDIKIPEPIITARIRFIAEKSPSSLFSCSPLPFSCTDGFSAVAGR